MTLYDGIKEILAASTSRKVLAAEYDDYYDAEGNAKITVDDNPEKFREIDDVESENNNLIFILR